ncbi:MAG: protein-disulfide isomerase [Nitrososphaerales archaeon]
MRKQRASKLGKKKRKWQLIAIGIIAAVAIGLGYGIYNYIQNPPRVTGFGAIGSAHEHAAFKLFINNEELVDFSLPQYQVKSRYIHFEDENGVIIHKHATGVDLGFHFEAIGLNFDDECIIIGSGNIYCNEGEKTLKLFVNGLRNDMYDRYVLNDGDKILISYGNETEEEIEAQLNALDLLLIPPRQP